MQPSFSTQCTQCTQIRPFGGGNATRVTCETPQQPSTTLSSSMCATGGFGSGVNNTAGMIRPM